MTKQAKGKAPGGSGGEALLYQLLETEIGGVEVYRTALKCVVNEELREEWTKYKAETERHVDIARDLLVALGLNPDAEVPARAVVRTIGEALVASMERALKDGDRETAQLAAADCVIEAETKDHQNWELVGVLARSATGDAKKALEAAHDEVEVEEDHHLYHSKGWGRELSIEALGLPAVFPPPEESKNARPPSGPRGPRRPGSGPCRRVARPLGLAGARADARSQGTRHRPPARRAGR